MSHIAVNILHAAFLTRQKRVDRPKGGFMNNYEVLYVLSDKQEPEARTALVEKFKTLAAAYGEPTVDEWGSKKLAYPIQTKMSGKHLTGYYVLMKFTAPPEFPAELERQMRISDGVLRFMVERV